MLKVPQTLKGNLRVERRTKRKKKNKSKGQNGYNEWAERYVLQVQT